MLWVDSRGRVDLKAVVGVARIFKEKVHWVEHLVGEKEEPFPSWSTIVQPLFSPKHNIEPSTKILRLKPHDLRRWVEERV